VKCCGIRSANCHGLEDAELAARIWPTFACSAPGDLDEVRLGEVRAEHEQPGEVELARGQRVEQRREASDETSGCNSAKSLVLREAELVDAVRVEARAGARAVNAARFDFAEVDEELGEQLVRATNETAGSVEELGVGELLERRSGTRNGRIDRCVRLHTSHDTAGFSVFSTGILVTDR
jgi:hypothetical protein